MGRCEKVGFLLIAFAATVRCVVRADELICRTYGELLQSTSLSGTMADKATEEVSPMVNCSFVVSALGIYISAFSIDCEPSAYYCRSRGSHQPEQLEGHAFWRSIMTLLITHSQVPATSRCTVRTLWLHWRPCVFFFGKCQLRDYSSFPGSASRPCRTLLTSIRRARMRH